MQLEVIFFSTLFLVFAAVSDAAQRREESGSSSELIYQTWQYTSAAVYNTIDWMYGTSGGKYCPYNDNIYSSVEKNLKKYIQGQDEGINSILHAISGWKFAADSNQNGLLVDDGGPLVLAITGPTGVGKSETAYRLAEGILAKKRRVGGGGRRGRRGGGGGSRSGAGRYLPSGLLTLRGEDFAMGDVTENQEAIRHRLVDHLEHCDGNAVVVFDEVQKVLPGTLDVLMPALDTRGTVSRTHFVATTTDSSGGTAVGAVLSYLSPQYWAPNTGTDTGPATRGGSKAPRAAAGTATSTSTASGGAGGDAGTSSHTSAAAPTTASPTSTSRHQGKTITTQYSTDNAIFIFISDIGVEKMTKLVLKYGNRSTIPQTLLRSEIKTALDDQWSRLRFGKVIREVVPFLPLEPEHIRAVLHSKLRNLAADFRFSYWHDLQVDDDVVAYLTGPEFIKYAVYQAKPPSTGASTNTGTNTGASSGTSSASSSTGDDGANTGSNSNNSSSSSSSGEVDSSRSGSSSTSTAARDEECLSTDIHGDSLSSSCTPAAIPARTKTDTTTAEKSKSPNSKPKASIFATWGARSLENAGPLQDLKSAINRFAQPWRHDQVLHIGLVSEKNLEMRKRKWGTKNQPTSRTGDDVGSMGKSGKSLQQIYMQWCLRPAASSSSSSSSSSSDVSSGNADVNNGNDNGNVNRGSGDAKESGRSAHDARGDTPQAVAAVAPVVTSTSSPPTTDFTTTTYSSSSAAMKFVIDDTIAFSDQCETIWFGKLV